MSEMSYINRLLPGFQTIGFAQHLTAMLYASNVGGVRATLPALVAQLVLDGVVVTVVADPADLVAAWNDLCDQLNADPTITIHDYENCMIGTLVDLGVKWNQLCVALDRESALCQSYQDYFANVVVPFAFQ